MKLSRVNTKRKGDNFERKVAKIFTEWFGSEVRRTPLSGATGIKIDLLGDRRFPFLVECKKDESWRVESVLSDRGAWSGYLEDLDKQKYSLYYSPDKIQLLVIARNYSSIYAIIEDKELEKLKAKCCNGFSDTRFIYFRFKGRGFYMFLLTDFLSKINPDVFWNENNRSSSIQAGS